MNRVEQSVSSSRCGSAGLHVTGHHPFPTPVESAGNSKCPVPNTVDSSICTATATKVVVWSDSLTVGLPTLPQVREESVPEELLANEQHTVVFHKTKRRDLTALLRDKHLRLDQVLQEDQGHQGNQLDPAKREEGDPQVRDGASGEL